MTGWLLGLYIIAGGFVLWQIMSTAAIIVCRRGKRHA